MLAHDGGAHGHGAELETEPERIERLGSIREVVFGAQDGLVSTFAVVAGLAAAGAHHLVVLLAGLVSAVAGVLSMSIGTFLSSRAQRQVYEAELARERREIREHPGEEVAELVASLMSRGMSRGDAVEVGRRIARHPDLLLETLGVFELGLAPQRLGTPVRDAFVMAAAFGAASVVPLVPFVWSRVMAALGPRGGRARSRLRHRRLRARSPRVRRARRRRAVGPPTRAHLARRGVPVRRRRRRASQVVSGQTTMPVPLRQASAGM
jgi:VIT1/CCC1 family predicted Fe2+/Mn2+ transporter